MPRTRRFIAGERGAIFVQVGIALVVLMAFSVFVIDYGVLWIARSQAQAAADAGALAGAIARGYDDRDDPPHPSGLAAEIARSVAAANSVWREAPTPVVSFDCPPGVTGHCTRVDVHRDGDNASTPVETLFGPLLGVSSQRIRATATADTGIGNATPCLRPIAIADDWDERRDLNPPPGEEFSYYIESGPGAGTPLGGVRDEYTPPTATYGGRTTVSVDFGERIVWTIDHALFTPISRGMVVPLDLPGGRTFIQNMAGCVSRPIAIGQTIPLISIHPGDVVDSVEALFAQDPGADYDYGNSRIVGSCAPGCAPLSPRLIAIALYDPRRFQLGRSSGNWTQADVGCPTNLPCITIRNIVGFFIHRISPTSPFGPHGHILRYPGILRTTAPTYPDDASWLVTTQLIR